ncbi:unnamed protein product [Effrenium voratum]|nr:unnamed protein product [Effrenium voratum]
MRASLLAALAAVATSGATFQNRTSLRDALVTWAHAAEAERQLLGDLWGDIEEWDVSTVTNFSGLFRGLHDFNEPIPWNTSAVEDMSFAFEEATSFNQPLPWDTSSVRSMRGMFKRATSFNQALPWNTSAVRDMSSMFDSASAFNEALEWDVSAVTNLTEMFLRATSFNQPLAKWNTSAVEHMTGMFVLTSFNQALDTWDVSAVTGMSDMFFGAESFNQPLAKWNTSAVEYMNGMFWHATSFNQALEAWDTSSVRNMAAMFGATSFNQPLAKWNTSAVVNMSGMFFAAADFNQALETWDISAVTDLSHMFYQAKSFNKPLHKWNTSAVQYMSAMFYDAIVFNQDLDAWDTSSVRSMEGMFVGALAFNQAIGSWDTSAVTSMAAMFQDAASFNRAVDSWNTSAVVDMSAMFFAAVAFNQALNSWDTGSVQFLGYMFVQARNFNKPLDEWNTSSVARMESMFFGAAAFNQPLGTWDFSSLQSAAAISGFVGSSGMSACNLMSLSQARGLPPEQQKLLQFAKCPSCHQPLRPCESSEQACVDSACHPVNFRFVELGSGHWESGGPGGQYVARGYRHCAEACDSWINCSAFVLADDQRCTLHTEQGLPKKYGEGTSLAFLKPRCEFFSCPAEGVLIEGDAFTAASCCRCRNPLRVQNLSAAPALQCVACPAGSQPINATACGRCPPGSISSTDSRCKRCGAGFEANEDQSSCVECADGHFARADMDACRPCSLPLMRWEDECIWWHLPIIILLLLLLSFGGFLWITTLTKRRQKRIQRHEEKVEEVQRMLEAELWEEEPGTVPKYSEQLQALGWAHEEVLQKAAEIRKRHSNHAGVGLRYLLSEFTQLAQQRARKTNPDFYELKQVFWLDPQPLGEHVVCPRDGDPGCALVDLLSKSHRKAQTHFMSWTWHYTLGQLQSALKIWSRSVREANKVFFFMCFFTNNQFRILRHKTSCGTDNLGKKFEEHVRSIGQVVAILDDWSEPVYLRRVWTVYEQYVAYSVKVPVTFVMPEHAQRSLTRKILQGEPGIRQVTSSLCRVDSAKAEAYSREDEVNVKAIIQASVGFEQVNKHVREALVQWISGVVRIQFNDLVRQQFESEAADREEICGDHIVAETF